jgi:thymidine kinase
MFLETNLNGTKRRGWIEVIVGSMFSGKTEELIRRMKRAKIAKQEIIIFKPQLDNRYSVNEVVSHDANSLESIAIGSSHQILELIDKPEVVGIDEGQFFDMNLVHVCNQLAGHGVRVIVAGLDMDYKGIPFGPMPHLLATAEYVTKVHAICMRCGNLAQYSHRLTNSEDLVFLGAKDAYEPLCRSCFDKAFSEAKH